MRRALLVLVVQLLTIWAATASGQLVRPKKTEEGLVGVVPSPSHLVRNGRFTGNGCDVFDLREMNVFDAAFNAAHSALSSRHRAVGVCVAPGAAIRTRNAETFGAFKSLPPVGEQVRQFSCTDGSADLYLGAS